MPASPSNFLLLLVKINVKIIAIILLQDTMVATKKRRGIMPLAADIINNMIPISDFSRGKASGVFAKVAGGTPVIVLKNNAPLAVITSPAEHARLTQIEEDYALLCESIERLERKGKAKNHSFADVMSEFGITEAELDDADEVEFE
ncbi:MAG: type II toxin-antitoxin system prevent-host-death family antitoxin [Raoultibacter sp.]